MTAALGIVNRAAGVVDHGRQAEVSGDANAPPAERKYHTPYDVLGIVDCGCRADASLAHT